ncbi:PREDICTED: FAD-linked sulfhydryl oxidase ALR [Ceratosolen solmsi marchali]|uniref:Sulfhydryl oxidase n=1 Tax=Ceratosolen solmsi marchali TaxID=326594 RepID=A0AAJ6YJC5_9HYME|nr:PREDICTED: FAD-linked sulfhydryl oxidase ALR [Ceratosolen solmsi marchali]
METISNSKPCRTCTDFTTWVKLQKKTFDSEQTADTVKHEITSTINNETTGSAQKNCPLDKDELGLSTWNFLHTMAAYYPSTPTVEQKNDMKLFFHLLAKFYPCTSCAKDLMEQLKTSSPETDSQYKLSQWLCRMHNEVNKKLGKPEFNCKLVDERWLSGWADGSCD